MRGKILQSNGRLQPLSEFNHEVFHVADAIKKGVSTDIGSNFLGFMDKKPKKLA